VEFDKKKNKKKFIQNIYLILGMEIAEVIHLGSAFITKL